MVKELRERTGAGMMDCKKALVECDGDMDKAIDFLREKGLAAAAKKAGRIAAEGMVDTYVDENGVGVIVEVNCETDFVANTDRLQGSVPRFRQAHRRCQLRPSVEELLAQPFYTDASKTVNDLIGEATASIGEKISVRRFARFVAEHGMVDTYNHMGGQHRRYGRAVLPGGQRRSEGAEPRPRHAHRRREPAVCAPRRGADR